MLVIEEDLQEIIHALLIDAIKFDLDLIFQGQIADFIEKLQKCAFSCANSKKYVLFLELTGQITIILYVY